MPPRSAAASLATLTGLVLLGLLAAWHTRDRYLDDIDRFANWVADTYGIVPP